MNKILRSFHKAMDAVAWRLAPVIKDDKTAIILAYLLRLQRFPNLKHPKTFNEKLQWLKLYQHNPLYTTLVDKVAVKQYVSSIIGEEYIIPTIGVWDNPDQVDYDSLPDQFVLKCNHNSGGLYICKNKDAMDVEFVKKLLWNSLNDDYYLRCREWPYKDIKRKVFAEKYLANDTGEDLIDYKFFCFNGEPKYCQVISNRSSDECIDFYDMEWKRINGLCGLNIYAHNSNEGVKCPSSFSKMLDVARALSKDFVFIRIDLYEIKSKPYFGEMTFFPNGGYGRFTPPEWNTCFGEMIDLSKIS